MPKLFYRSQNNLLQLLDLKDERDDASVTDAIVTAQLKDADGQPVGSLITLTYITGSNGDYAGPIPDSPVPGLHGRDTAEISANAGLERKGFWILHLVAKDRNV